MLYPQLTVQTHKVTYKNIHVCKYTKFFHEMILLHCSKLYHAEVTPGEKMSDRQGCVK
jgi:hypothetical protein